MVKIALFGAQDALSQHLASALGQSPAVAQCQLVTGDAANEACEVAIYCAIARSGPRSEVPDLDDAAQIFARCTDDGVRHLIVLSSAFFFEPNAAFPGLVWESYVPGMREGNQISVQWQALEALARTQALALTLTILRLAPVLTPTGRDFSSRLFRGPAAMIFPGRDPSLQFLAADDLATALARVVERRQDGVFHLAADGVVPLRRALQLTRTWRVPLPLPLQWPIRALEALFGRGASADQREILCYPITLGTIAAKAELDFQPKKSSSEILGEFATQVGKKPPRVRPESLRFDDFGMDEGYIATRGGTLLKFLHDVYWRIEVKDFHHVPTAGPAVMVGMHRGHQPWDGAMMLFLIRREIGRYIRFLIHPSLTRPPFLSNFIVKLGGLQACQQNADHVLQQGGLVGIFPEGIRGTFLRYREVYKLQRFGRPDYVRIALRNRAPIVPFVTVGSAEIFPIFGKLDWGWWKRLSYWPCFPITPTMSLVPLPSKWHTWFLEPLHIEAEYGPEAAENRAIVERINQEVHRRMNAALDLMLERRKTIFWGSIFQQDFWPEDSDQKTRSGPSGPDR